MTKNVRPATGVVGHARDVFHDLSDARFERRVAHKLLAPLYLCLVACGAYALLWLVWWTFQLSPWLGWLHALVVFPLGLFGATTFFRALLEFGAAVLDIREHVTELGTLPARVSSWPAVQKLAAISIRRGFIAGPDRD